MTATKKRSIYAPTYHRDGTITYWDVYLQQWVRCEAASISAATCATQDDRFRAAVRKARSSA